MRKTTWYWRIWWWFGYHGLYQINWWWYGYRKYPWSNTYPVHSYQWMEASRRQRVKHG